MRNLTNTEATDLAGLHVQLVDPVTGEQHKTFPANSLGSQGAPVTVGTEGPPTEPSLEGAIHLVTDDGLPTGTVLEQYIYDTDSGVWIEMQRNAQDTLKFGTASPTANGEWDGEEFFVTSDGTSAGEVLEQWIWDKQSSTWIQRPNPEFRTTSLTPVVYDGGWVGAQADIVGNLAKEVKLSDGTILASGLVTWTGHGLTVGETYYTSQTAAGGYVTPEPTSGLSQKLFTVIDANTIDIQVQEGVEILNDAGTSPTDFAKTVYVNATSPSTATIFDLANPPTTNDNTLKADTNNIYIGTDGSSWTYNSSTSTYTTYTYPTTVPHGFSAKLPTTYSVANNTSVKFTSMITENSTAPGWNTTTGTFTAQRAGWYQCNATLGFLAGSWANGTSASLWLAKNGTIQVVDYKVVYAAATSADFLQVSKAIYLNAGDTVEAFSYQNSGAAKTAREDRGFFSIVEVR